MKKIILISLVFSTAPLFGQKSFWGMNAGINIASQRVAQTVSYSPAKTVMFLQNIETATVGFFYQSHFSNQFALRVNSQYVALGSKTAYETDMKYLMYSLSFRYLPNPKIDLNIAPYFSFLLNGKDVSPGNIPIDHTYSRNDFGFSFGGEYELGNHLAIGINYFVGMKNIQLRDHILDNQGNTVDFKITNRALQFVLIYKSKRKPFKLL